MSDREIFELHKLEDIVAVGSSTSDLTVHTSELKISAIKLKTGKFILHGCVIGVLNWGNVLEPIEIHRDETIVHETAAKQHEGEQKERCDS